MKKFSVTLLAISCIIMVLVSGVIVCNATINPEVLAATSYITLYGESVLNYTYSSTETINDFSGGAYRLCLLNPKGYLIMYSTSLTVSDTGFVFVELDEEYNNPYSYFTNRNITGDKLYAGPGQYYIRSGNIVYGADGSVFEIGSEQYNVLVEHSNTIKTSLESEQESTTVGDCTYISNYKYFKHLGTSISTRTGLYHTPDNEQGTCSFIDLAVLLGYYRVYSNNSLVADSYMQPITDNLLDNQSFVFSDLSIDKIYPLPTVNESFLEKLVKYTYPSFNLDSDISSGGSFGGFPAGAFRLKITLDKYFEDCHTAEFKSKFTYSAHAFENSSAIKNEIDSGRPVILSMIYLKTEDLDDGVGYSVFGHSLIAYGYVGDTYIVFDDFIGGNKKVTSKVVAAYLKFEYTGEHCHSTDMRFLNNGCYGTYCPCGSYTVCNHIIDENNHCICQSCGQSFHNFVVNFSVFTATAHSLTCTRCGDTGSEYHTLKSKVGGHYCTKCNYDSTVEGEISLRDPDKSN